MGVPALRLRYSRRLGALHGLLVLQQQVLRDSLRRLVERPPREHRVPPQRLGQPPDARPARARPVHDPEVELRLLGDVLAHDDPRQLIVDAADGVHDQVEHLLRRLQARGRERHHFLVLEDLGGLRRHRQGRASRLPHRGLAVARTSLCRNGTPCVIMVCIHPKAERRPPWTPS